MPTATKDAETKFCTSEELKRQTLNGRQTLRPDSTTGIPYQNLINLYLVQCAEEKKVLAFA